MAELAGNSAELTAKQEKAINVLLCTRTVAAAATVLGCSDRTLWRWMAEPVFHAALVTAEDAKIDAATRRLITLQDDAIGTVESIMGDQALPAAVRLRAALSVLDCLLRLRELRNFEARIAQLELSLLDRR